MPASMRSGRCSTADELAPKPRRPRRPPEACGSGSPSSTACWRWRSGSGCNELVASRAAIAAATDAVRSATEARRVIGERFAAGVAVSVDVLDAQVALLQAGLDRTQAIATARLAEARLDGRWGSSGGRDRLGRT